jgi:predicted nucleic acid-binding protein
MATTVKEPETPIKHGARIRSLSAQARTSNAARLAERLLQDAEELRASDPALFRRVVEEIAASVEPAPRKDIASTAGIFKDDPDWQMVIAAIATANNLIVVTENGKDFKKLLPENQVQDWTRPD